MANVVAVIGLVTRAPVTPQDLSSHDRHVSKVKLFYLPDVLPRQFIHAARLDQRVPRVRRITVTPHVQVPAAHAVLQAQRHQVAAVEEGARLITLPRRFSYCVVIAVVVVTPHTHGIVLLADSVVAIRGMVTATQRSLVVVHEGVAFGSASRTQVLDAMVHLIDTVTAPALVAGPSLREVHVDLHARDYFRMGVVAKVRLLRGYDEGVESRFHAAGVQLRQSSAAAIGND